MYMAIVPADIRRYLFYGRKSVAKIISMNDSRAVRDEVNGRHGKLLRDVVTDKAAG